MPASNYLDGGDNLYGLPSPVPAGLGEQASAIVDAYLKRPEGLLYVNDKNNNPCYMKGLEPSFVYQITGPIAPGLAVQVTVSPANVRPDLVGEVLILDRANPDLVEAVVVSATSGTNQLTLRSVQFAHPGAGSPLVVKGDVGVIINEERTVPSKRSIARYSKFPCPAILSLMGRYGFGRRSDQVGGLYQEANLLAAVQTFGGPPQWVPIAINQTSWSDATGEIWVPAGVLLAYYSDIKIKYVAGFPEAPEPIVRATAAIALSLTSFANYGGGQIKSISAGDSRIQRFGATNMDDDTKKLLDPYKARTLF